MKRGVIHHSPLSHFKIIDFLHIKTFLISFTCKKLLFYSENYNIYYYHYKNNKKENKGGMQMRTIVAQDVVSASKFNRFHLFVFIWCFYAIGFDGYDIAMYGVGLPWMMEEWNLSALQAGAVGSYSLFGMMIGALVLAPIADKFGRKNVIVICMVLFSVFTLAAGLLLISFGSRSCALLLRLAWAV